MKLSPVERAMLREMGVAWPYAQPAPTLAAPSPGESAPAAKKALDGPLLAATALAAEPASPMLSQASPPAAGQPSAWEPQLGWDALQSAVSACRRCGLCETRRNTVFGAGHPRAQWMVVGEAPGEQEDRLGQPFVGAAGQLLDRMLGAIGLSRGEQDPAAGGVDAAGADDAAARGQRVFITNTVKCRPPQNRNPDPSELAACEPVLQRQMQLVQPRLVLAMGRFAAQQLLRSAEPIGRLRGRVHRLSAVDTPWAGAQGVPVVVTYHPAYLLRNPIDKAKAWDDLCLALDTWAAQGQA